MVYKATMVELSSTFVATSSSSTTTIQKNFASAFYPHIFTTPIHFKLDEENYLIWQQQVLATLHNLNLTQFLDFVSIPPGYQYKKIMK